MSSKEYENRVRVLRTLDIIENETKDYDITEFMAIMSTAIEWYSITHDVPALEVWTTMFKVVRELRGRR